jgi:hypothetical protein
MLCLYSALGQGVYSKALSLKGIKESSKKPVLVLLKSHEKYAVSQLKRKNPAKLEAYHTFVDTVNTLLEEYIEKYWSCNSGMKSMTMEEYYKLDKKTKKSIFYPHVCITECTKMGKDTPSLDRLSYTTWVEEKDKKGIVKEFRYFQLEYNFNNGLYQKVLIPGARNGKIQPHDLAIAVKILNLKVRCYMKVNRNSIFDITKADLDSIRDPVELPIVIDTLYCLDSNYLKKVDDYEDSLLIIQNIKTISDSTLQKRIKDGTLTFYYTSCPVGGGYGMKDPATYENIIVEVKTGHVLYRKRQKPGFQIGGAPIGKLHVLDYLFLKE